MITYKLQTALGEELGEAKYRFLLEPGEELTIENGRRLRVIKMVPVPVAEQGSDMVALLYVEGV